MQAPHSSKAVAEECEKAIAHAKELAAILERLGQHRTDPEFESRQQQLHEVSTAIAKMEAKQIIVPSELRRLKADLLAQSDKDSMSEDALATIHKLLAERVLSNAIRQEFEGAELNGRLKSRRGLTTRFKILRTYLLKSLHELGGAAEARDVLNFIQFNMKPPFLPGDLQPDTQGVITWRKNISLLRSILIKEGILRADSRRGFWELTTQKREEAGRQNV